MTSIFKKQLRHWKLSNESINLDYFFDILIIRKSTVYSLIALKYRNHSKTEKGEYQ